MQRSVVRPEQIQFNDGKVGAALGVVASGPLQQSHRRRDQEAAACGCRSGSAAMGHEHRRRTWSAAPARSSQSARNSAGRTGAGASMCATFLSFQTGRRSVRSSPGQGTTRGRAPISRRTGRYVCSMPERSGRKHNPLLLIDLLRAALDKGIPARLVVASEGEGIEAVREIARTATGIADHPAAVSAGFRAV